MVETQAFALRIHTNADTLHDGDLGKRVIADFTSHTGFCDLHYYKMQTLTLFGRQSTVKTYPRLVLYSLERFINSEAKAMAR